MRLEKNYMKDKAKVERDYRHSNYAQMPLSLVAVIRIGILVIGMIVTQLWP